MEKIELSKDELFNLLKFVANQQKARDYQDAGHFLIENDGEGVTEILDELSNMDKNWFIDDVVYKNLSLEEILSLFKEYESL